MDIIKNYILEENISEDDIYSLIPFTKGNHINDYKSLNLKRYKFEGSTGNNGFKLATLTKIAVGNTYPHAISISVWQKNFSQPGDAVFIAKNSGFFVYYDNNSFYLDIDIGIQAYYKSPITDEQYVYQNGKYSAKLWYEGVIHYR